MSGTAEPYEGSIRTFEFRLAALNPETSPLLFEVVDVVARSDSARIVVGFRIKPGEFSVVAGNRRLHVLAVDESYVVVLQQERVAGHVAVLHVFLANGAH